MSTEPTSALTLSDLITEVAHKLGTASYGADGAGALSVPTDTHDLAEAQRLVNNAIRMFIADAPRGGWRWLRPVASVTIWSDINVNASVTVTGGTYDSTNDETLVTATADTFYESMEEKFVVIDGTSFRMKRYATATTMYVYGDASAVSADTFSIASNGNYTLPRTFGGQYTGKITYAAGTNQGIDLEWSTDANIRAWREDIDVNTGDPFWAAIRVMDTGTPRRRWELMMYPEPDEVLVVEFPYTLHFDSLVDLAEVHPAPIGHDEAIKAACRAMAEREINEAPGPDSDYYRNVALPNSYRVDAASAPKRLGYFGNPGSARRPTIHSFRNDVYQRPDVPFNP